MKIQRIKKVVIVLLLISCLCYLKSKITYTSYESKVEGKVQGNLANWNIKVNNTLITKETPQVINIDDIVWETNNTRENKIAPGSRGTLTLTIDPEKTDVSIDYELQIIDKNIDDTKILTVTNIKTANYPLTKQRDTYKATFPLKDIKLNKKETITITIEWIDTSEDIEITKEEQETKNDDFIVMNFKAIQKK